MNKDREAILAMVQQVLMENFELSIEDVQPDKSLYTDMDLDSLDAIDLAVQLSAEVGKKFTENDLREIRTVTDIVDAAIRKYEE